MANPNRHRLAGTAARSVVIAAALGAAVFAAAPPPAGAHLGRYPEAIDLSGTATAQWIAVSYGGVLTSDHGSTWGWFCEEVLGYPVNFNPRVVLEPGGGLLTSTQRGIAHSDDGGCHWRFTTVGMPGALVSSMAVDAATPNEIVVTAGVTTGVGGIYRSIDGGLVFSPVVERDQVDFSGALRAGNRVYVVMRPLTQPIAPTLFRSLDGGAGFAEVPLVDWVGNNVAEPLAIDPGDPDTLYLAIRSGVPADRLARLTLSGSTPVYKELLATDSRIRAVAPRKDGSIWLATAAGLKVSGDGGGTWGDPPGTPPAKVTCLIDRADGLYACADDASDGFAIGRTVDGVTWQPHFRFQDMAGPIACPADSPTATVCGPVWFDVRSRFLPDAGASADASVDAGVPRDAPPDVAGPPADPGGCGCRIGSRSASTRNGRAPGLLLLLFAIVRRYGRQAARSIRPSACRAKRPSSRG